MAYAQVEAQFTRAVNFADAANTQAQSFITALQNTVSNLSTPNLDVDNTWPEPPSLAPAIPVDVTEPAYAFPTDDSGEPPVAQDVTFSIDSAPAAPSLPTYTYSPGTEPSKPVLGDLATVTLPDELDDWVAPDSPELLNIVIRPFEGVNSHGEWVDRLSTIPADLVLAAPTAFTSPTPGRYDSGLLQAMTSEIRLRLAGGTGLAPAVEQAIWDRARSREAATSEASIAEVVRNAEGRGFSLPTGALAAQTREAQKALLAKTSELSRDIAMKQADLEQANVKHAIEQGIALETRLIDYVNNIEQRTFDAAKFAATNAVEIYNALVAQYRVTLDKYNMYAGVYRSLIEGERAKVDAYRAEVDAESTKVGINKTLIDQQRAEIEVRGAEIALYRSQLEAVQTLLSVDKMKIEAFGERVRAYTAEISAETVRVEAFKTLTQSNQILVESYKTGVDAYASKLRATSEAAKVKADIYDAQVRGFVGRTQRYATAVSAEAEKVRAGVSIGGLRVEQTKALVLQNTSNNQLQVENYKALIGMYESNKSLAISRTKVLSDNYFALRNLVAEASKVAAQVNAQLAASAYGTIHANAGVSGADQTSTSFNYSGDTSDSRAAPTYS